MLMSGRTWKNVDANKAENIKKYLLEKGGIEVEVKSFPEVWRVKFSDSTFTYYKKGTLYSAPSVSFDPEVSKAWKYIDSFIGSSYVIPTKDFLVGLDETGKGEVIGHTILTGAFFPNEIFRELDLLVGPANTKKRHKFEYWDDLFRELDGFRDSGLDFKEEKIPPWHVDRYNLNKIMDVTYQRILSIFFRNVEISRCRIVLDDYGLGPTLSRFLNFLEKQGAEIVVTHNAEDTYLEAKIASLISKRTREIIIKKINENPKFKINGLSIGSGNAGDTQTISWLKEWYASGREWPWFIKRSFKTIRKIEGKLEVRKLVPPIREELLSKEFLEEFNKGGLSTKSLFMVCPHCGGKSKAVTFAVYEDANKKISQIKCPSCKNLIKDAGITLRYYCGYLVPDTSVIRRELMSKDLESSRTFEDFTVVLTPVVRKECDKTRSGKTELERLAKFASLGRIRLESLGDVSKVPEDLTSQERDELIVNTAIEYNAILLTADNLMKAYGISREVFTLFI